MYTIYTYIYHETRQSLIKLSFLNTENVTTYVQTKINFPKYMNETVMVASSMKVDFSLSAMRINLDNLFNGNKVLGK